MVELIKAACHEIENGQQLWRDVCTSAYSRLQKCVNNVRVKFNKYNNECKHIDWHPCIVLNILKISRMNSDLLCHFEYTPVYKDHNINLPY